ncbi:MAG: GTPase Era [bacterium]
MSPRAGGTSLCGYAAIAGVPNVGKSTLLNALVGMKLSIISPKPQTTRRNVIGVLSTDDYQAVLVDTPGLLDPAYRLHEVMQQHARNAIQGSDVLLLMIDASGLVDRDPEPDMKAALEAAGERTPVVLALNKVDRTPKPKLLPLMDRCRDFHDFRAMVPISALKSEGIDDLLQEVVRCLPEGPRLYPDEMITDQPERFFISELVREVVFHRFGQEVPYATMTRVDEMEERGREEKDYIRVNIFVERPSQKGILLGKGGRAIREVGTRARKEIEEFLGRPVYLELWVKVKEDWRREEARLKELDLL